MNRKFFLGFLLSFIFISSFSLSDDIYIYHTTPSNKTCLDDYTAQYQWNYVNSSSQWTQAFKNVTCKMNCSSTLNDCRVEEIYQMHDIIGYLFLIIGFCMFGIIVGRKMLMMDFPIYAVLMFTTAMLGGSFDVYIERYQTILLSFFFIPLGFFFLSLFLNYKNVRSEKRATGR